MNSIQSLVMMITGTELYFVFYVTQSQLLRFDILITETAFVLYFLILFIAFYFYYFSMYFIFTIFIIFN